MFNSNVMWHEAAGMAMAFQVLGSKQGVFRPEDAPKGRFGKWSTGHDQEREIARTMCPQPKEEAELKDEAEEAKEG